MINTDNCISIWSLSHQALFIFWRKIKELFDCQFSRRSTQEYSRAARSSLVSENSPSSMPSPTNQWTKALLAYIRSNLWSNLKIKGMQVSQEKTTKYGFKLFNLIFFQRKRELPCPSLSNGGGVGKHAHGTLHLGLWKHFKWMGGIDANIHRIYFWKN